jgi:hypothetical protein
MIPVVVATAVLLAAATGWHAVADHHCHLRVLRRIRPGIQVPVTSHVTWWHGLSWPRKAAVNGSLLAAGGLTGLAWLLSPVAATTACAAVLAAMAVTMTIRAIARRGR